MKKRKKMKLINNYSVIFLIILSFIALTSCQETWPGLNFEQFENTEAEELAYAVKNEDLEEIERLVKIDKINVNFQEPSKGNMLLKVAILAQKEKAIEKLLELGADPNLKDWENDESSFLFACSNFTIGLTDLDLIKKLVKYGGDVNLPQKMINEKKVYFQTPLMLSVDVAVLNPKDELFYYLIDKGADIDVYDGRSSNCVVVQVASSDRMDLLKFLIIDKKAKIPEYAQIWDEGTKDEERVSLVQYLQKKEYEKSSDNNVLRDEILDYLNHNR